MSSRSVNGACSHKLAAACDGLEFCLDTALGSVLDLYVWLRSDCIACSRRVLQLAYNGVGNFRTNEPAAMLSRAYSALRVLERRVVAVRLREELSVTGFLRNKYSHELCRSPRPSTRVLAPI